MKKILLFVLFFAIIITAAIGMAEELQMDGFVYRLNDESEAVLCGFSSGGAAAAFQQDSDKPIGGSIYKPTGDKPVLIIPDTLDGHPVVEIAESAFAGDCSFSSVVIPASVRSIGDEAFISCNELFSVELADGLQHIGYDAFAYTEISEIHIPASVQTMGANPFNGCNRLEKFTVNASSECFYAIQGVLFNKPSMKLVSYPAGTSNKTYVVPESTVIIGENAFMGCELTSVYLPYSIREVESYAFAFSNHLEIVSIPYSMSVIAEDAFYNGIKNKLTLQIRSNFTTKSWAEAFNVKYEVVTQ